MEEKRKAKIIFGKSGGNASKGSYTNRITLPTSWIKEMGITQEDREVEIEFINGRITIRKP